ncbi:MAG TPA: hypothetical protein VER03_22375, partial [Bryobacteraceae bacterium]|nr:hypothetical protein [Bryobacteraceae bacterium]
MRTFIGLAAAAMAAASLAAAVPEFEPNAGQADSRYSFLARASGTRVYIADSALEFEPAVRLKWLNTNHSAPLWSTSDPTGNVFRYCNQPSAAICAKSIPTYKKLRRPALYPGIDWVLYGRDGQIEYDLVLAPGADVRQARLRVEGAPATLDAQGRLHAGSILHWQPEAYQIIDGAKVSVKAELRRHEDGDFGFILGNYRRDRELVIDPVIQAVAAIGGAADDEIRGFTSTASSSSYRYGVTRSGDWNRSFTDKRKDVFIQVENGASFTTLFWGGSGDEEIGGADFDPVNPRLTIVGWSSSQDALLMSPDNNMRPYAGGASDGFLLQVEWQNLTYANFLGGPGTDRLNDVRTEGSTYAIAGETDDVSWPNALAERIGAGGKVDAFVGQFDRRTVRMVVTGGSGDDRASRLRRAGSKRWVMVGDTDSPDFPATDGVQAASARDVWVGLLSDELRPSMMRLYGGSGNESAAGVFHVEGAGLYVGGTTTSLDLPGAVGPFRGGESDGFMIQLDAVSGMPLIATYIGGSGADEISTMDGGAGDLRIGGSTASAELNVPGLTTAEKALGGRDGLFVLCDLTTAPVFGLRVGGSEDDRVLSVASSGLGKVRLAGWSESAGWLGKLDEFRTPGGRDGFVVDASFSAFRVTPDAPIYIGRNLQTRITIDVAAEPGNDGMLLVRSSDPSKLLVSTRWDLIGTEQVLLSEIDVPRYEYMRTVVLQALSDEGDVDIILEPRAGAPSPAYPSRRVRVKLTPSGLFVDQAGEIVTRPGSDASLEAYYAAVLPDGKPGPKQTLRGGLTSDVSLVFSNPALAATPKDPPWQDGQGGHRLGLRVLAEGVFTATPVSSHVRLGQPVTIRAASNTPVVFNRSAIELAKDHQTTFAWVGSPGDSLRFTTDDPARLRVGRSATELSESVTLAFDAANQLRTVWIEALDREGVVTVRVDGTLNGKGVDENLQITLLPYKATLNASENRIGPGREIYFTLTTTPQISGAQVASGNRQPAPRIASARLISTSPEVLKIEPYLSRRVAVGVTPGTARVEWEPGVPPELQEARVDVEVVPLVFTAIVPELLVPAGGEVPVSVTTNGSRDLLKTVRLRMATPTPFTIGVFDRGTDVTVDFTSFSYDVTLSAGEARAGETGTVQVSAPGLPPFNIPVRVVAPLFLPTYNQVRARTQGMLQFDLWGDRDGSAVPLPPGARIIKPATVRATSSAPGLCAFPDRTEFSGGVFSFNIPFTCSGAGKTLVALQPGNGASSIQAQYAVEVTVSPTQQPERRLDVPIRVLTGAGVQAPLGVRSQNGIPFRGTLTSTDPDRVRLALSPEARGGASVRMQSSSTVYVQGFATEGVVTLRAESEDGLSSDIAVHLFPATMAVRPDSYSGVYEDRAPNLSIEQALSEPDLPLIAVPFLLEPASRKLIYVQGLQVRGATDPVFLPGTSSDEAVATIVGPGAILQEGAATTPLKLKIHKTG